eukprot:TRINITY_DN4818_c0_g1_i1.p2 TRINITY_DN4818_c0_g1~~TRINITY_DN4818_c0_g1_i1.p2  ORF type:complete len:353 (+),score=152.07 TRINITY_DN4818_c0_g1_i1:68-1126(+)
MAMRLFSRTAAAAIAQAGRAQVAAPRTFSTTSLTLAPQNTMAAACPKIQAQAPDLKGRVAIISGSTRGIGKECAVALAKCGCNIVVVGKSVTEKKNLPGSIFSVADEIKALGVDALPCQVDMRDAASIEKCVEETVAKFGRIDIVINNASALWWQPIVDTPVSKYDLINGINSRGSFILTKLALPYMVKNKWGRVITMSPPIQSEMDFFNGFTAYNMSKMGMTMVAMGAGAEGAEHGITGNSLWPATIVESQASKNFKMGTTKNWRKASILSDAVLAIMADDKCNGRQLIDDEYLMGAPWNLTPEDLKVYRFDPDHEPARALARSALGSKGSFRRGNVNELAADEKKSKAKM